MAIADRHIHIAATLIAEYDYTTPFHHFLSSFFSRNRQMGSRDRKTVREACYAFFRFGKLLPELSAEEKIRLVFWSRGLIEQPPLSMGEGAGERSLISFLEKNKISLENLFPCTEQISSRIPQEDFAKQHLFAGKVFFRKTRKGTTEPFDFAQGTSVEQLAENTYSAETATSLNALTDKGFVQVQDLASQEMSASIS